MTAPTLRQLRMLSIFLFGLCALPFFAQTTVADPNDPIYADIDAWSTKGLLKNLPRLRPYTMKMTVGLLKEVAASDNPQDAAEANRYLEILEDTAFHVRLDALAQAAVSDSDSQTLFMGAPGISLNGMYGENLGISARMAVWLTKGKTDLVSPYGDRFYRDPLYGSGSGLGGGLEVTQDVVSSLSYGDEGTGIQAGYMRGSWGPIFDDGVVIGPQAPESGQFTFSWRSPSLTADVGFFLLQQGWPSSTGILDSLGKAVGFNSGKYLIIHGINWAVKPWLELGLFESIVYVDRIEPLYFIPLSEYFVSQSVGGYGDNAFAGLSATAYLPHSMKLDLVGYADDLDFAKVLKGNLDTKWKLAVQAGLSWAPESQLFQLFSADYTAVGPYTYTHWTTAGNDTNGSTYVGAMAYTNAGENLGPALDPNSDRITLQAKSRVVHGARLTGILRLIRHGNASAGIAINGIPYTNATSASGDASGDLGDSGVYNSATNGGSWIFQGENNTGTWPMYLRFLTQSVLQVSAQAGFSLEYTRSLPDLGTMNAGLSYLFEYIANNGCVAGATSVKHYLSFKVGLGL